MIFRFILELLFIPGIIAHEMAHVSFCRIFRVKIHKACYLRFGNPPGYVVHDAPSNVASQIIIGTGPFLFNTILGLMFALIHRLPSFYNTISGYVALWLAISVAAHAFPSKGDAKSIWRNMPILGKIASFPVVSLIYIGAFASVFRLNFLYGVAVALYMPDVIISAIQH